MGTLIILIHQLSSSHSPLILFFLSFVKFFFVIGEYLKIIIENSLGLFLSIVGDSHPNKNYAVVQSK